MLSILATLLAVSGGATGSDVEVFPAVTPSIIDQNLAEVTPLPPWRPGDPVKLVPRRHIFDPLLEANPPKPVNPVAGGDPLIDETWLPDWRAKALGTPALNLGPTDGAIDFVGGFPPDTVGDVGQDYYIQSTNGSQGATYVIFNKSDGSVAAPAFSMSNLPGATPACRDSGAGDPIVLYDELAGRWLLTEFTSEGPNRLCVYVSRTGDPISGGWFSYDFQAPSFPDYPKYGVWPDAYYVGTNEGVPAVYALERTKMLLGQAARMMRSAATGLSGFGFQVLQPADVDGTTRPPAGAPGLFLRHRDDEVHNPGSNDPGNDFLEIFEFDVDFEAGTGSLNGPTQIAIADIDSDLCGLQSFECFQQPNTTQTLDPLREPVMRRVQYRNFGDYETLVGNLTTDVDTFDRGGIRFFELRRTGGGQAPWELFQEGTLAPDGDSRWMGSAAMDSSGNIAIGYSVSSSSTFPSLRYTGRLSTDANGALTAGETTIIDGSQSQTAAERWGDYSALSVDPADGCTFWFTSEYVENDNQLWSTRIASFKFDECGSANFTLMGTNLSQEVCTAPGSVDLQNVTLTAGAIGDFNSAIQLDFSALPSGFTGDIQPTSIMPGGSGTASISASGTAPAGNSEIVIRGTSGSLEQTVTVNVLVTANAPGQVVLSSPADGAADVLFQPTFSWSAVAGADQYRLQLASDAGFGTIIEDRTVNGTSLMLDQSLATGTEYFWRVTAQNACGDGTTSNASSFTTATVAGGADCPSGHTALTVLFDDFESGAIGWTTDSTWALQNSLSFSGSNAFLIENVDTQGFNSLFSPNLAMPAEANTITLTFQNQRDIEVGFAPDECFDGGIIEFFSGNNNFFQIPGSDFELDPYNATVATGFSNPIAGSEAWCGQTGGFVRTEVDITDLAGTDVSLLWTLAADNSEGTAQSWIVDDVEVVACLPDAPASEEVIFRSGFEADEGLTVKRRGTMPDKRPTPRPLDVLERLQRPR